MEMKMKPVKVHPEETIKIMERMSQKLQKVREQLSKIKKDLK